MKRIPVQVSTQSSSFSDSDENIEANRDDLEKPKIVQKTRSAKVPTITEREKKGKLKKKKYNTDESDDEIKTNSKKRRIKKHPIKVSRETESEDEKTNRRKVTHRKWTDEEIKAVKKHLQSYIQKKINPGKAKYMAVLKKEPVLQNRTWMQLNTYVNNIYKKK